MLTGTSKFDGDLIEVKFRYTGEITDYGVPRSPEFVEWGDPKIEHLEICGVDVNPKDLPADLVRAIYELAGDTEVIENAE